VTLASPNAGSARYRTECLDWILVPGLRHRHRLDEKASKASEALAKLRWRWTMDETNSERVSVREYARQVGRARTVVRKMAQGYADWTRGGHGALTTSSLSEAIGCS
jgi:hypothetical protein